MTDDQNIVVAFPVIARAVLGAAQEGTAETNDPRVQVGVEIVAHLKATVSTGRLKVPDALIGVLMASIAFGRALDSDSIAKAAIDEVQRIAGALSERFKS